MTKEENDLLTLTGPGTPCGELMRRYWQPAALSEELSAGGPPLPVRLLGEDLVLFRDDKGRPGLLGIHCSHRRADLSYGRVEDGGLRCIYHGWLYDIQGRCLDQPGEPGGGEHKGSIRHPAYACQERAGVIFTYMGPGEPPLLPNYEFLTVPEDHVFAIKLFHQSNYLQANEGNIDLLHVSLLHYSDKERQPSAVGSSVGRLSGWGGAPGMETIEAELIDVGVRVCKIRKLGPDKNYIRVATFILPNLTAVPGHQDGKGGYTINWHVPIDNTHHWKYTFIFNRERPLDKEIVRRGRTEMTPDYKPIRNKTNRYQQDRNSMEGESYSGIGLVFQAQDLCVVEGAGPIQDRTKEHLVASDAPIVVSRKLLLRAIKEVQEGRAPPNVIRDPELNRFPNIVSTSGVIPRSINWKEYCNRLAAEIRP